MNNKKPYRWTILAMLFVAMVINYVDRAALSIAMPFITQEYHLTPSEKGMIFSSFFFGYALFCFVGGYLADRFGPKRVLTWSMGFWSVLCGATALAFNFWSLLIVRALFGVGEGPVSTTANKAINSWFPVKERARAIGFAQAGGPLGGALAGPIVGFLAIWLGWRVAFIVIASFGLLWALAWWRMATSTPVEHPKVSPEELAAINDEREVPVQAIGDAPRTPVLKIIGQRAVIVMGLSLFCYNYILYFFMTWFPSYLIDAKGIDLKSMSIVTALPWFVGTLGFIGGGLLIDWVFKRTGRRLFSRKVVLVTCLLVAALCVGFTGQLESVTSAVVVMTLAVGFLMLSAPAYWSMIQDAVPDHQVGTAGGFMHGLANLSGIVAPTATGLIIQSTGTYGSGFALAGGLGIIGALIVAFFVTNKAVANPELAIA
ncbi:MFS transporter, ACS family, hexuronate transporter [Pseudomonas asturiensis]|uniref:MFS transporter, ACS family, hexuronate transporter n=1 Tax=Pseudomonas asturiensis TaxID=1190415 RepID=A0A1M7PTY7_9PSED|nr:MFS transporter [Pseudomonas asturiensis]SHN20957.1 MFS transporter, ACS family, hexuronate transporter [Pseudomonas asturiensis]